MSTSRVVPCLWLDHGAEEAAAFYVAAFPEGRVVATSRYPESLDTPGGMPRGSVLTVEVELAGARFTLLNGGPLFRINPSISFFVRVDTAAEADAIWAPLADGGTVLMPLGSYPWSERFGWVQDRFGVSWQVIAGRRPPNGATIAPCLMYANAVAGRAAEALAQVARLLGGDVASLEPYGPGEGPETMIKHGRVTLGAQDLLALDSHVRHAFDFDEGVSLQVMCDDQAEVDRLWAGLAEGGSQGPCGWLKDRFGVSWQVVPTAIAAWLASPDVAARDRVFAAMLTMTKLDVAALTAAFEGR